MVRGKREEREKRYQRPSLLTYLLLTVKAQRKSTVVAAVVFAVAVAVAVVLERCWRSLSDQLSEQNKAEVKAGKLSRVEAE